MTDRIFKRTPKTVDFPRSVKKKGQKQKNILCISVSK